MPDTSFASRPEVSGLPLPEEARMRLAPIEITPPVPIEIPITEEEILADLLYPAPAPPRS